ncbi:MAG: family N-acetyltransferase [Patescibacteria group bacterium]|jgi:ribosomal protein S18 acetylase RimI-like enzyme|nr:family N-acetyltransferase [Patescibacteria group bacterium]
MSDSSPTIRLALESDYPAVLDLLGIIDDMDAKNRPEWFKKPESPTWKRGSFIDWIEDAEEYAVLIALIGEETVGMLQLYIDKDEEARHIFAYNSAYVKNLAVKEEYRNQGIGKKLMQEAEAWALNKGIADMELHVWTYAEAGRHLYEELEYEAVSTRMHKKLRAQE